MRPAVLALVLLLMISLHAWPAVAPDGESVYKGAVRSVMTLEVETTTGQRTGGTAFLALRRGVAVTAWHVVSDARRIKARFSDGRETIVTRILDKDEERDLAVLELADSGSRPMLRIASDDPPVGSRVYLLGAPEGLEFSISEGIVNQIRRLDGTKLIQYSAATNPGNSGGPLLDAKGIVVGVCVGRFRDSQNLNFAVKAWYATQMNTATNGPRPTQAGSPPPPVNRPIPTVTRVIKQTGLVWSAAFSPDGRTVVTASTDKTARLWDVATGRELRVLTGHTESVMSAAFSPYGLSVVTASLDGTAILWNVATGRELRSLKGHQSGLASAAFSQDGKTIVTASGDKTARIWDAATGKELHVLNGHTSAVLSAAFSPDGEMVVTASSDKTARLWNAATGTKLRTFSGHTGWVNCAEFSPDGNMIVTASEDKTARLWDVNTGRA